MTGFLAQPHAFPDKAPAGFDLLGNEPVFDPSRHLQIERPDRVETLRDFGYSQEDSADCPTDFAATSVFRVSTNCLSLIRRMSRALNSLAMARERLQAELNAISFEANAASLVDRFAKHAALMTETADQLRAAGTGQLQHFGEG